jgi:membrane fusion protein, multidrug efflux system
VLALAAVGYGVSRWRWGLTHIHTDNAQVEGHVVPTLARVGGFVLEVAVRENQTVQAGQPVVRLDDREAVTRLAQAEADLQQAIMAQGVRGRVGQAEAQLDAARANVTQAEANAQRARQDADRAQRLAARGIVSSSMRRSPEPRPRRPDSRRRASRRWPPRPHWAVRRPVWRRCVRRAIAPRSICRTRASPHRAAVS